MSEITKMLAASGLLAAGFFSASLFGTPGSVAPVTGSSDDWAPRRLEPIESAAMELPTAVATWDADVAPAGHTGSENYANRAFRSTAPTPNAHQVARPNWPERQHEASSPSVPPVPEIRRGPIVQNAPVVLSDSVASFGARAGRNNFAETTATDDRFASLSPPPLFETAATVPQMRPSRFPARPSQAFTPPTTHQPMASPTTAAPLVTSRAEWDAATGLTEPSLQPPSLQSPSLQAPSLRAPSLATANSWEMSTPVPPPQRAIEPRATGEPIWHVVSDGDSLAKIAERYFRDGNRAREIYELNRDVLTNPDLLPIGAELRIPQTLASPGEFEVFDASGSRARTYAPQSRLVPLPELPASVRSVPRARLQGPVSASMIGRP